MKKYYSGNMVGNLLGISQTTIMRWKSLGLLESLIVADLPGNQRNHYGKSTVVFTFLSIVQAKVLKNITLQSNINATTVKKVVDYLTTIGEQMDIHELCLVRLNNNLLWIRKDDYGDLMRAIIVMGNKRGQYEFTPMLMLSDALNELKDTVVNADFDNKDKFIEYLDTMRKAA